MSSLFNLDPSIVYLNHAAVSPWPVQTVEAVRRFAEENGSLGAAHYPKWLKTEERLRRQLARLIKAASPEDIALLKSTSEGLSTIAHGLNWNPGDNIVSIAQEFPSNRIVWESLQQQGVELRLLDLTQSSQPEQELIALCNENTRLISVSSVQYASGLRLNLDILGQTCRQRNILFCIDAIQSLGALPFDISTNLADFVVADGHKWMLGPEGLALFYCRAEVRSQLKLHQFGWHMIERVGDFDRQEWTATESARRFECGSPNMLGIHALQASLDLIEIQDVRAIQLQIQDLAELIVEEINRLGFELLSPNEAERRGGILTFRIPGSDNQALQARLMEQQVICAYRGGGIRFSPHFYNTDIEIREAFKRLCKLL